MQAYKCSIRRTRLQIIAASMRSVMSNTCGWMLVTLLGIGLFALSPTVMAQNAQPTPSSAAAAAPHAVNPVARADSADRKRKPDFRSAPVRQTAVADLKQQGQRRKAEAIIMAQKLGLPIKGPGFELMAFEGGQPIYYITHNVNAAISTGANLIRNTVPYNVNGSGEAAAVWDEGAVRTTHQEFAGRVTVKDGTTTLNNHATHVAGTIGAAGVVPVALGMAPSVSIDSYDWNSDESEMADRAASYPDEPGKIYISNHSYGSAAGWSDRFPTRQPWYWIGTNNFGRYSLSVATYDGIGYEAPYYLICKSSGNDRSDNPTTNTLVWIWDGGLYDNRVTYNSSIHPKGDGIYKNGYDCIEGFGNAKNILTIGAVNDAVTGGARDAAEATMTTFSSWGPADDGRVKPDVVGNGYELYSTYASGDAEYRQSGWSGTSMATPNVVGSIMLLQHYVNSLFSGHVLRASTIKAIVIHTADDIGNSGPDYINGWGLVNVKAAADLVKAYRANQGSQKIMEGYLRDTDSTHSYAFTYNGAGPIRVTLCWTDPPGKPQTANDVRTPALVNDLDLVVKGPGGTPTYRPYVLDVNNPANLAGTGENNVDNVEQVYIASSSPGVYTVTVDYDGILTNDEQFYSMIISGGPSSGPMPIPQISSVSTNALVRGASQEEVVMVGSGFMLGATVKLVRSGQADIVATGVGATSRRAIAFFNLSGASTGWWDVVLRNTDGQSATLASGVYIGSAETPILTTDFATGLPSGWTVVDGNSDGKTWTHLNPGARTNLINWSAPFMIVDSQVAMNVVMDEHLVSPVIDCSAFGSVVLGFNHYFKFKEGSLNEKGDVDVKVDGGEWQNVVRYAEYNATGPVELDISSVAAGRSRVQIRWRYYGAFNEYYWGIDNVAVRGLTTGASPTKRIDVSPSRIAVPENGSTTFDVWLSQQPATTIAVAVARSSGDPDINISSAVPLVFTKANYATHQTVTVQGAVDADLTNGIAGITCSATGFVSAVVEATEIDNSAPPSPDVIISKSVSPSLVLLGSPLTYTLTLVNKGTAGATNVVATDWLPSTLTNVVSTASRGTVGTNGSVLTWNVGNLSIDGSESLTIVALPKTYGSVTNTARVTWSTTAGGFTNSAAPVVTAVRSAPVAILVGASQAAMSGDGRVSIDCKVFDNDGDTCKLHVLYSLDGGNTWSNALIETVISSIGSAYVTNSNSDFRQVWGISTTNGGGKATNSLTLVWNTITGPAPVAVCTNTVIGIRAWADTELSGFATSFPFAVDNAAPVGPVAAWCLTHALGAWSSVSAMSVHWIPANDGAGSGVAGYAYVFTNVWPSTVSPTIKTTSTNATSVALPDGSNWWFGVRAVDNKGNWGLAVGLGPFKIDASSPLAPANLQSDRALTGQWTNQINHVFTWAAPTNCLSGMAGYSVGKGIVPDNSVDTMEKQAGWSNVSGGTTTFYVKAVNTAGTWGATATFNLRVDTNAPVTTCDADASWHTNSFAVRLSASDNQSGVARTQYRINGGSVQTGTNVQISTEGSNTLAFWSSDSAGNIEATSQMAGIKLDLGGPVFANWMLSPTNLTSASTGSARISVEVNDAVSGIGTNIPTVDYYVTGGAYGGWKAMSKTGNAWTFDVATNWISQGNKSLFWKVRARDVAGHVVASPEQGEFIERTADLSVSKTVNQSKPNVGETITYTLRLTNSGPDAATGIEVADRLPSGVTYSSHAGGAYNSRVELWTVGTLANGSSTTMTIQATVNTGTAGSTVINTARVSAVQQADTNAGNNAATASLQVRGADVGVSKAVNNSTPNQGDTVAFTVTARNYGPDSANGVQVADLIPAGLTLKRVNISQGLYSGATGLWQVGTLTNGGSATLQLSAQVSDGTAGSTITNRATKTFSTEADGNTANDQAVANVRVLVVDIGVAKSVSGSAPTENALIAYTLVATNSGPDGASGLQVLDVLPSGLTYSSHSGGLYVASSGIWTIGALAGRGSTSLVIQARVNAGTGGFSITNTAQVYTCTQADSNPANNTGKVSIVVEAADLAITKAVNNSQPNVGDSIIYTLAVTNKGPNGATDVTVNDTLPTGIIYGGAVPSQGSYNGRIWNVGSLAIHGVANLQISATIAAGTAGMTITNEAYVHANQSDPTMLDRTNRVVLRVRAADLGIVKSVNQSRPNVGEAITYALRLTNSGPDAATGIEVADRLPSGVTYASHAGGAYDSGAGLWTVGTLANGSSTTMTIQATVNTGTAGSTVINTARVSAVQQADTNAGNNVATANLQVRGADVSVSKVVNNDTTSQGDTVVFTVTARNFGPDSANSVQVADLIPAGLALRRINISQGSYSSATGLWQIGTLTNGVSATLQLSARVNSGTAGSTITNRAAKTFAEEADGNTANNQASVTITVVSADLAISKTASPMTVPPGSNVLYAISVTNMGPFTAHDVVVTDMLPNQAALIEVNSSVGDWSTNSSSVVFHLGSLSPQTHATMMVTLMASQETVLTNMASVTATEPDTVPANNSASVKVIASSNMNAMATGQAFLVDTNLVISYQANPAVDMDAAGNFVVVWETLRGYDPADYQVVGQRFDASGRAQGDQFVAASMTLPHLTPQTHWNPYQRWHPYYPDVSLDRNGNSVIAWFHKDHGVQFQCYLPSGLPLGPRVSTGFSADALYPYNYGGTRVVLGTLGRFFLGASRYSGQLGYNGLLSLYSFSDTSSVPLLSISYPNSTAPQLIGVDSANDFCVKDYRGGWQLFDSNGTSLGPEMPDSTNMNSDSVARMPNGEFVVAGINWNQRAVYAQKYSSMAVPNGEPVLVCEYPLSENEYPCDPVVAVGDDGHFAVAWLVSRWSDVSWREDVYLRRFTADGLPFESAQKVNGDSPSMGLRITMNAAGDCVVVWQDYADPRMASWELGDIFAKRYGRLSSGSVNLGIQAGSSTLYPNAGDVVSFEVVVTNGSATTAAAVVVKCALSQNISVTSWDPMDGFDPATETWSIGSLPPGSSATLTLNGIVDMGAAGLSLSNAWTIQAGTLNDDQLNDNHCSVVLTVRTGTPKMLTASCGPNVTISPSGGVAVAEGGTATINITAAPDYHIDQMLINGARMRMRADVMSTNVAFDNVRSDTTLYVSARRHHLPSSWLSLYALASDYYIGWEDTDNDGMANWQEYYAGTDPLDLLSYLMITDMSQVVGKTLVEWSTSRFRPDFPFVVQSSPGSNLASWTSDEREVRSTAPAALQWTEDVQPQSERAVFYRLLVDNDWGGICPTFIQLARASPERPAPLRMDATSSSLVARIMVPVENALLRSDIPIYGVAGGTNFADYRVEYGEGYKPEQWHLIEASSNAQNVSPDFGDISWMQGDLDLRGNLATWNTGLKNWEHLPWHPADDPTDCNGIYTIRLVAQGRTGEIKEDRVTCEAGRAIAQCLPGIAISPDKAVVMRFPEQALPDKFRVYTIFPFALLGRAVPPVQPDIRLLTDAYRIREPGEMFIKYVSLEFPWKDDGTTSVSNIGICRYDSTSGKWVWMPTRWDDSCKTFSTTIHELPLPEAIYALAVDKSTARSEPISQPAPTDPLKPVRRGVLLENDFEQGLGTLRARDLNVGAQISIVARDSGGHCLEAVNPVAKGNFSFTVLNSPFDVNEYPHLSFEYQIDREAKVDLFLRVSGRWYRIRLTGNDVDFYGKDVNIADLGTVTECVADGEWNSYGIDLKEALRKKTGHSIVEEIFFANWSVAGYMALDFGQNVPGARIHLDNMRIKSSVTLNSTRSEVLWIDRFSGAASRNELGNLAGSFGPENLECRATRMPFDGADGNCLVLDIDVSPPGSFGGYWTELGDRNLAEYGSICFRVFSTNELMPEIALKDVSGRQVIVPSLDCVKRSGPSGWTDVQILLPPLGSSIDLGHVAVLSFGFSSISAADVGRVLLDDIRFEPSPIVNGKPIPVADFEGRDGQWNLLGGRNFTFENGAGSIHASQVRRRENGKIGGQCLLLAYGGSIGLDLGQDGFSFCGWEAKLGGIDLASHRFLEMNVRGLQGGEQPNVYLTDGVMRRGVDLEKYGQINAEWRVIRIPIRDFADRGIDITHVESIEFVFEWDRMSGAICLDDVSFQ